MRDGLGSVLKRLREAIHPDVYMGCSQGNMYFVFGAARVEVYTKPSRTQT